MNVIARLVKRIPSRFHVPVIGLGIWLLASMLLVISTRAIIVGRTGWDPDDQLRLVQLRDFLGGQGWFDNTQYRLNAPDGAPMHWSRLIELPLALIVSVFAPFVGSARAEMLAGTAVPLGCLGIIALVASDIASRLAGKFAGIAAIFLTFLAPAILIQNRPMRIDHHGWQVVMAMLGLWTVFWGSRKWGGIVLGLALATWLHISLEGAPLTAAFFLLLGWRWIVERAEGVRLFWTLTAFAVASLALFFGTQSAGLSAQNFCDTISPMHIGAIVAGSAILLPAIIIRPEHRRWRILATLVAGAAIVGCLLVSAPICARGAFAGLDPLVREYWYVHVSEGLPIWRQDMEAAVTLIAAPLVGIAALVALRRNFVGNGTDGRFATIGYFTMYAVILSFAVFRTVSVAAAFAVIPVSVWIAQLIARWRVCEVPVRRIGLVVAILLLAIPGGVVGPIARKISAATQDSTQASGEGEQSAKCESVASVRMLSLLPDSNIIAPFDMGPAILMATRHRVLASSHHRNEPGMRDQIQIFRSNPDISRAMMLKRGIRYIAVCPDEAELGLYAKKDPKGLWAALSNAKVPDWLVSEGVFGDGIMVWRVKDAGNP